MTYKIETKQLPGSKIEIIGSIEWDILVGFKTLALDEAVEQAEIDGFRKGKAPRDKVEAMVGTMTLLSRAAELALDDTYPRIVIENKLMVMGQPSISLTKLAEGNPLEFKIETAVFPVVKLGDYKAIAKKHNEVKEEVSVTEEEMNESIDRVRHMMLHQDEEGHDHADHNHDELPELTTEFVQTLGDFGSVEDFTDKVKSNIHEQKSREADAKRRELIITEVIEASQFDVPELLVESEQEKMVAQMKDDISRMGLQFEKYLEHIKKTEAELREEWKDDAFKRAQAELVLKQIAKEEGLTPDKDRVEAQVDRIKKQYNDVDELNIRMYVEGIFMNETTLEFLDKQ